MIRLGIRNNWLCRNIFIGVGVRKGGKEKEKTGIREDGRMGRGQSSGDFCDDGEP